MSIRFDIRVPIYKQLANLIKEKIEDGTYRPGDQIPPENTLCAQYEISRVTVRKSIKLLADEGLVVRSQGKGTFVAMSNFIESAKASGSFTLSCIQNGVVPSTDIVLCEETECNEEIAKDLELSEGGKIILIKRVRYANSIPVIFETDYIPADKHSYLLQADLKDASLLDTMKNLGNVTFGVYDDIIDIRYANEEQAEWLRCKKNAPLLGIYQKVYDSEDNIEYINEQFIVSDRYKYVSSNKR